MPGPALEEELQFEDRTADGDTAVEGAIRYLSGAFRGKDAIGVYDFRSAGSGITAAQHKVLRDLIHFIDDGPADGYASGAYRETEAVVFPTWMI